MYVTIVKIPCCVHVCNTHCVYICVFCLIIIFVICLCSTYSSAWPDCLLVYWYFIIIIIIIIITFCFETNNNTRRIYKIHKYLRLRYCVLLSFTQGIVYVIYNKYMDPSNSRYTNRDRFRLIIIFVQPKFYSPIYNRKEEK